MLDHKERLIEAYNNHADSIYRHIYFKVYDEEIAKELMQESFIKTWDSIREGKEINNLKAFIYKTAKNLAIDYIRKRKEDSLEYMMEKGFSPAAENAENVSEKLGMERITQTIKLLPDEHREIIEMRYIEDLGIKEIAKKINKSENSVSVRINRALNKLRSLLKNEYE